MTTWSISEAAAKWGLSQHALRWYERIGLVGPVARGGDIKLLDCKIDTYARQIRDAQDQQDEQDKPERQRNADYQAR